LVVAVLALGACHASIGDDPTGALNEGPDGGGGGGGGGGGAPDAAIAIDAPPAPAVRVVYLNFEGVTLTKGATSDATQNIAAWLNGGTTGTSPGYEIGKTTRTTDIASIASGVTSRLSAVATVTTTRPTSGPYVMVVYGGTAAQVHSFFGVAVSQIDCGDVVPNDVAWIADSVTPTEAVNTTLGAIGLGLGLAATATTTDCMCSWGNNCTPSAASGQCVLSNAIAIDSNVTNDPNTGTPLTCAGGTQNELTVFQTAFH
jgi:hypothetical protein